MKSLVIFLVLPRLTLLAASFLIYGAFLCTKVPEVGINNIISKAQRKKAQQSFQSVKVQRKSVI